MLRAGLLAEGIKELYMIGIDFALGSKIEAMEWNSSSAYLIFLCHVAK